MSSNDILWKSRQVYRRHLALIFATVAVVWLPFDLLISYMDAYVFAPEEWARSHRFGRLMENTVGLIVVGAVIQVAVQSRSGTQPVFSESMSTSLRLWGWMFWTRLLTNFATVICLLLLIFPGIYVAVRLCTALQVVMTERHFGTEAMRRSFALTKGRFWRIFFVGAVIWFVFIAFVAFLYIPLFFVPLLQHWIMQGIFGLFMHVGYAFVTIAFTEIYLELKSSESAALAVPHSEATIL